MPLRNRAQVMQRLRGRADEYVRAMGLEALGRLMRKTPVDIGRARANWNVTTARPDTSTDEGATASDVPGKQQAGQRTILSEFKAGGVLYLVNGLDYAPLLENGHSSQAPNGMVKVTAKELRVLSGRVAARIASGG